MSVPARAEDAVGVLVPLYLEARTARPLARAGWQVVRCGAGATRAAAAARALTAAGVKRLLVWGTAGGLDPALTPGTLVIPERVVGPAGESFPLDPGWRADVLARLGAGRGIRGGLLASTSAPVATGAEKAALAGRTGAAAVDMEAAAVVAAAGGVPCAVLRAVVDPLELTIPKVVLDAAGDRFLAPEIALRLLLRPRDLPAVLRLARAFRPARRALRDAARALAGAAPGKDAAN